VTGKPVPLAPEARLAIYRAAQEGLTNVRKHAHASDVTIRLQYRRGGAELTVEDVGDAPSPRTGAGYGLSGMRERAELLGGTLDAGPTRDGFRLRLWVPA
jgi:signal transduction histidine kinase